jgi:hypothetical protein
MPLLRRLEILPHQRLAIAVPNDLTVAQLVALADRLSRQVHRRLGLMLALVSRPLTPMMVRRRTMMRRRCRVMRRRRMTMRDRRMTVAGGEAVTRPRSRHRRERRRRFGRSRRRSGLVRRALLSRRGRLVRRALLRPQRRSQNPQRHSHAQTSRTPHDPLRYSPDEWLQDSDSYWREHPSIHRVRPRRCTFCLVSRTSLMRCASPSLPPFAGRCRSRPAWNPPLASSPESR